MYGQVPVSRRTCVKASVAVFNVGMCATGQNQKGNPVERATEISRQPKIIANGRSNRECDASPRITLLVAERAGKLQDVKNESPPNAQRPLGSLDHMVCGFRTCLGRR